MNLVLAADTGGGYVAAAYAVFVVVMFIYFAIMAKRMVGIQESLSRILRKLDDKGQQD